MASNISSTTWSGMFTNNTRLTGLATGLDTDQMVRDLMSVERIPLDKLYQKKQLAEWKRDSYRDITNLLRGLKDEFFNVLKSSSNMLSANTYKKFTGTSTDSTVVTATGNALAVAGSHKITVNNLATASVAVSGGTVTKPLESTAVMTTGAGGDVENAGGKTIKITLDGVTKDVTIGTGAVTAGQLAADLETSIGVAFGAGKVKVTEAGGKLTFETMGGASKITLADGTTDSGLGFLHIASGTSNRINTSQTLASLADQFANGLTFDNGNLVFKINSKEFTFSETTILSEMMNTISSDAEANVSFTYDESTDKFKITAKQMGSGDNIILSQTGGDFFGAAGAVMIDTVNPVATADKGKDASVEIDGITVTRSTNIFTLNGVTYTLLKESTDEQTVTLTQDVANVYDNIKKFVDKYNEILAKINGELSEKYDRSYLPLTDEQKSAMSEEDIKKWEEKAKTGILKNDPILSKIVSDMRRALSTTVAGESAILSSIGITTGNYEEKGKLIIDETKLKSAIANNPDTVMNLFMKQSATHPFYSRSATASERSVRYNESGLIQRLSDILEDNISTFRDSNGKKGILLEKAGITGDMSEFSNTLYTELQGYDRSLATLTDRLIEKENNYYKKFANLEAYINKMNTQSSWLTSQFSQS